VEDESLNQITKNLALWIVIAMMLIFLFNIFQKGKNTESTTPSYSQFIDMVENNQIKDVEIQGQELFVTNTNNQKFSIYVPEDPDLIRTLKEKKVSVTAKKPPESNWLLSLFAGWFPFILLIGVWIFFMRQMQSGGGKAMSFGKSRARLDSDQFEKVTFEDVAGIDEAKEELGEIIEFLKEPKKYTRLGGRIPKGVLLMGSPGTGKTLLARAIAGEAGVPFFFISGSDFVEMFVGVGASRVRDLFVQGKRNAPCIIFIDEIDAVGRHRGAGLGGGHDEREQTLNQLLVEMDGFESNEGVILVSATNRPDVLDPALLRPGRFDRQVIVPLPDIKGREQILRVHMRKTPNDKSVDPVILAKGTPGFSGADLENLVNEAALLAAKKNKEKLGMADYEDAKDKVYMGLERKSKVIKDEEKRITAFHEAGHALVSRLLPGTDPVNKITIIPRGRALGVTWYLPDESDFRYKDQLESRISSALGGRVAEELVFKRISTGAASDIKQVTEMASNMVRTWGMSDKLGPLSYANDDEQIFLGREIAQHRDYSEETAKMIDAEIRKLVTEGYERARKILNENMDVLTKVSEVLLEKETIFGAELDEIILSLKPGFVFPSNPAEEQKPKKKKAIKKATS